MPNFYAPGSRLESVRMTEAAAPSSSTPSTAPCARRPALVDRPGRAAIAVTGPEAADYLQGQLTNDVEGIAPGEGRYAALLDRKGHLQGDMRVLRLAEGELPAARRGAAPAPPCCATSPPTRSGARSRSPTAATELALASVIGPRAAELTGAEGLGPEHAHRELPLGAATCLAIATDLGIDLLGRARGPGGRCAPRCSRPAPSAPSEAAAEILRVESGRPRFGREMSEATMPAEAGIVERAVDFEKGCYIGQEPVARLHYRGRPNRVLRGLALGAPAEAGAALSLGEKEVGPDRHRLRLPRPRPDRAGGASGARPSPATRSRSRAAAEPRSSSSPSAANRPFG